MQTNELMLQQRLQAIHELQASAMDLLFSGSLANDELTDILEMLQKIQVEAVQIEFALNRARRYSRSTN